MKKGTFVRKGNAGFAGLTKTKKKLEMGRTLIVCQHCGGDVAQDKDEKFVCKKCGKESKPHYKADRDKAKAASEESLFNQGSIGLA
ncbi:MAG: hypothetical protein Q8N21_05225 [bacterium]|nr:hypothetical protein [bacterium]